MQIYNFNDVSREKTLCKGNEYPLTIRANNTMKSEIKCAYRVNFTKSNLSREMLVLNTLTSERKYQ